MKYIGYNVFFMGLAGKKGKHRPGIYGLFGYRGPEDQGIIATSLMMQHEGDDGTMITSVPLSDSQEFQFIVDTKFYGNIPFRVDTEGNPIDDCINMARESFFTGLSNPIDLGGGIGQHPLTGTKFFLPS